MKDWFEDGSRQLDHDRLSAFGIDIFSRYGNAQEIIEMLTFARLTALKGISTYVKEVFYDSKACICTFTLDDTVEEGGSIASQLHNAAQESIGQFIWFGIVDHGPMPEED